MLVKLHRQTSCTTLARQMLCLALTLVLPNSMAIAQDSKPSKTGPVRISFNNGRLLVNGKPKIVYGSYRDPSDDWRQFDGVKAAGFNLIHNYHFTRFPKDNVDQWIADAQEFLDKAHEAGCGVFLTVPRRGNWWSKKDLEDVRRCVNAVKRHPALWFWYLYDEPTIFSPQKKKEQPEQFKEFRTSIKSCYQLVHKLDPNHPVVIVDLPERVAHSPKLIAESCDTIWPDVYGRAYSTLHLSRAVIALRRQFRKPVLGVSHGGAGLPYIYRGQRRRAKNKSMQPNAVKFNDRTIENKPRYLRANFHALIASGSPGMVLYWLPKYDHNMKKDTPGQWKALCELGKEIKMLEPVILSRQSVEGVGVKIDHWGAINRAWELYGKDAMTNAEITKYKPLKYWIRKYKGSIYVGVATDHVPTQRVTFTMPFDIERIVVPNEKLTILKRLKGGKLVFDHKRTPVATWGYSDRHFTFLINQGEAVVLRFDPRSNPKK